MPKSDSEDEGSFSGDDVASNARIMHNNRYDEAHELSESNLEGSVDSDDSGSNLSARGDSPPAFGNTFGGDSPPISEDDDDDYEFSLGDSQDSEIPGGKDELIGEITKEMAKQTIDTSIDEKALDSSSEDESSEEEDPFAAPTHTQAAQPKTFTAEEESSSDEEVKEVGEKRSAATLQKTPGQYDPQDYASLDVADDVRSLFEHITRFTPQDVSLTSTLKPFIPEYIAAIGELDKFVKVPRPDGGVTPGTEVLDEPKTIQSDATVLHMQLKAVSKRSGTHEVLVPSMEALDSRALKTLIQKWIDNVADVHKTKQLVEVNYSRPMPEIEDLMQVWPEEVEVALENTSLPDPDMFMSTEEYVRMVCSIMDIPIHDSKEGIVQSLHVLFSLFSEFSQNAHFVNN